jgi:hypothetical protein
MEDLGFPVSRPSTSGASSLLTQKRLVPEEDESESIQVTL